MLHNKIIDIRDAKDLLEKTTSFEADGWLVVQVLQGEKWVAASEKMDVDSITKIMMERTEPCLSSAGVAEVNEMINDKVLASKVAISKGV